MIVHSSKVLTHPLDPDSKSIQPNAVDLRLINLLLPVDDFYLFHDKTRHRRCLEVKPDEGGVFVIPPRSHFQFETDQHCTIPENICGWLIARSSLMRNGLVVSSGLYDSGFSGTVGGVIFNHSGYTAYLEKGVRIAQLITADAETYHLYNGQYGDKKNGGI